MKKRPSNISNSVDMISSKLMIVVELNIKVIFDQLDNDYSVYFIKISIFNIAYELCFKLKFLYNFKISKNVNIIFGYFNNKPQP